MAFPICPYCKSDKCELVERFAEYKQEYGTAVECPECGLVGPAVSLEDPINEEREAIKIWNTIYCRKVKDG